MDEPLLNPAEAEGYETLGPAYFAAQRVVEDAMKAYTTEHAAPLVKEATDKFYAAIQQCIEDALWSDAEMNLRGKMWRMVDETVKALLSGEKWALKQYALGSRYDGEKVRAAIANHIPEELQNKRISDLEARIGELEKDIAYWRQR